jgi:hypothetical protein
MNEPLDIKITIGDQTLRPDPNLAYGQFFLQIQTKINEIAKMVNEIHGCVVAGQDTRTPTPTGYSDFKGLKVEAQDTNKPPKVDYKVMEQKGVTGSTEQLPNYGKTKVEAKDTWNEYS